MALIYPTGQNISRYIVGTKMAHGYKNIPGQNTTNGNEIIQRDKIRPVGQKLSTTPERGTKYVQWERNCAGTGLFPLNNHQINLGENHATCFYFPRLFPAWIPNLWKFTGNVTVVGITISWKKFT